MIIPSDDHLIPFARIAAQFYGVVVDETPAREPLYLAMQYIASGTLHDLIYGERYAAMRADGGFLPLEDQVTTLLGVFRALAYLAAALALDVKVILTPPCILR
jgi:hypothetical protein